MQRDIPSPHSKIGTHLRIKRVAISERYISVGKNNGKDFFSVKEIVQRRKSQRIKIYRHASGFVKDFSYLELAYGFLSQNLRFHFAINKHLTKVLEFLLADFLF